MLARGSPSGVLPSASPSTVLPGLTHAQTALDGLTQSALNAESQSNSNPGTGGILSGGSGSQTAATPESADSPSAYPPTGAGVALPSSSVQSTIEKAQFISTSIQPGIIPGYPSVEFPPSGISSAALWSGWPQQAYYKQ